MGKAKKTKSTEEKKENSKTKPSASTEQPRWKRRDRVLIFSSRGITHRGRHLVKDLLRLMPHAKTEAKLARTDSLAVINDLCEMANCRMCLFFDCRKKQDLYLWMGFVDTGPTVKFLVENLETMGDLKLSGNCLKGSRPIISIDDSFNDTPHQRLLKEMFTGVFATPRFHPKSQPFVDHCLTFSWLDNKVWFRNYQILNGEGALVEIGPRFVLSLVKVFAGSFSGQVVYTNPSFVSPNLHRRMLREKASGKYLDKKAAQRGRRARKLQRSYAMDKTELLFHEGDK